MATQRQTALSDQQFTFMVSGYDDEKAALVEKIRALEKEVNAVSERRDDAGRFVQIVRKYTEVQELTYEIVHEFIGRRAKLSGLPLETPFCICRRAFFVSKKRILCYAVRSCDDFY